MQVQEYLNNKKIKIIPMTI